MILGSGLCVLNGMVYLKKRGVYDSDLIRTRCCWTKYIDGAGIQAFMNNKQVRYQARLPGEVDGVGFDLFAMNEPGYTMMLMSTYGQLVVKESQREKIRYVEDPVTGKSIVDHFRYTEMIYNHFQFCGSVDDHKKKRMDDDGIHVMYLETTWMNIIWENRALNSFWLGLRSTHTLK